MLPCLQVHMMTEGWTPTHPAAILTTCSATASVFIPPHPPTSDLFSILRGLMSQHEHFYYLVRKNKEFDTVTSHIIKLSSSLITG